MHQKTHKMKMKKGKTKNDKRVYFALFTVASDCCQHLVCVSYSSVFQIRFVGSVKAAEARMKEEKKSNPIRNNNNDCVTNGIKTWPFLSLFGIVADVCLFFDHLNVPCVCFRKDSLADILGLYVDRLAHTFLFTVFKIYRNLTIRQSCASTQRKTMHTTCKQHSLFFGFDRLVNEKMVTSISSSCHFFFNYYFFLDITL